MTNTHDALREKLADCPFCGVPVAPSSDGMRERLTAWYNALPCESIGQTQYLQLMEIVGLSSAVTADHRGTEDTDSIDWDELAEIRLGQKARPSQATDRAILECQEWRKAVVELRDMAIDAENEKIEQKCFDILMERSLWRSTNGLG